MALEDSTSRAQYETNGTTGPFAVPFYFLANSHVEVVYTDVGGLEQTLALDVDYSVTGARASSGGAVTLTTPYVAGGKITILRNVPLTQLTAFVDGDAFPAAATNDGLDKLTMIAQEHDERLNRALMLRASDSGLAALPAGPDRANRLVAFDSAGGSTVTGFTTGQVAALLSAASISPSADGGYVLTRTPLLTATPGQTVFTVEGGYVPGVNAIAMLVDGLFWPLEDYTETSSSTVTTASPMAGGEQIEFLVGRFVTSGVEAGQVSYAPPDGVPRTAQSKGEEHYSVKDSGAVGDGVTDDTAAIQAALDTGRWCFMPRGTYLVSSELVIKKNSGLIGEASDFWQFSANQPAVPTSATTIKYVGAGGANSCVVRASAAAVGTLPAFATNEATNLSNVCLKNITIDGNNLAEFGLYAVRVVIGSIIDRITVTGTKKRGFFFGELFTNQIGPLLALMNYGTGGSIGEDLFSWSTGNIVNATEWDTLVAFKNGRDSAYNEISAPKEGVGWIVNFNRANTINNLVVELNYGAGAYISPRAGPNKIGAVYLEDNCHYDPADDEASSTVSAFVDGESTQPWGLVGYNRGGLLIAFDTVFGASVGSAPVRYQHVWLTGDVSGGFVTEPIEPWTFGGVYGVRTITSDFYNYGIALAQQALTNATGGAGQSDLDRCLPYYGAPESLVGAASTLYAGNTASGNKSGRDSSNRMLFDDAMECARVCSGVTAIDVSAMTSASSPTNARSCVGRGFTRPFEINGGTTAVFPYSTAEDVAMFVQDWSAQLTIRGMLTIDRVSILSSQVEIDDCPTVRTGANASALAALVVDRSSLEINGTSVVNVSASTAATKVALAVQGNSEVSINNAAAGTLAGFTAGNAIHFNEGSGVVRVSLTTATATWAAAASVVRNTGGGAGVVLAPNGLNP